MNTFFEFIIFSVAILLSGMFLHISRASIERRIGLKNKLALLFVRSIPEYVNDLFIIIILFAAIKISRETTFVSLIIILATKISSRDKSYGYSIFDAVCVVCILSSLIIAMLFKNSEHIAIQNPFTVLSFIVSMISISLFNDNNREAPLADISRNMALNIYLVYIFTPLNNFILISATAILMVYIQFLVKQLTPKFNVFLNIRYSVGILFSLSLLAMLGSIICMLC